MNVSFKFGSNDIIKFVKLYKKHECLWDTEHGGYKNRYVRNTALVAFANEFGVEGFGPREITTKIRTLRTQYHAERNKVKASMSSGSDTEYVYRPKLVFYDLMDSFLGKKFDANKTTSNLMNSNDDSYQEQENNSIVFVDEFEDAMEEDNLEVYVRNSVLSNNRSANNIKDEYEIEEDHLKNSKRSVSPIHIITPSNIEESKKRARLEKYKDDLADFGKYVTSALHTLNDKNCIYAQDEIQAILTKYKLKNMTENDPIK